VDKPDKPKKLPAEALSDITERSRPSSLQDVIQRIREAARSAGGPALRVLGTQPSLTAALLCELPSDRCRLWIVPEDSDIAPRMAALKGFFEATSGHRETTSLHELRGLELSPHAEAQPDRRVIMGRLATLAKMATESRLFVVASAAGLFRLVPPVEDFLDRSFSIHIEAACPREQLVTSLLGAGFQRVPVVEDPGTFAVRGAVVDIFSPGETHPTRLEFFGDDLESIRSFDVASQRTLRSRDRLRIFPVRETLPGRGADPKTRFLEAADAANLPSSRVRLLLEHIETQTPFFGIEALAPLFHSKMVTALDYLPAQSLVAAEDCEGIVAWVDRETQRLERSTQRRHQEHQLALPASAYLPSLDDAKTSLLAKTQVLFPTLERAEESSQATTVRLDARSCTPLRAELAQIRSSTGADGFASALKKKIDSWQDDGTRTRFLVPNKLHADRLIALLQSAGVQAAYTNASATADSTGVLDQWRSAHTPPVSIEVNAADSGFLLPGEKLAVVTERDLLGTRVRRRAKAKKPGGLSDIASLKEGDLVIHDEHGTGRYLGLKTLDVRGVKHDYLHLEYTGGSLYVPVYRIGLVKRHSGGADKTTRLDKLGGSTWQDKRRKASAIARKMAEDLLQLYAQRKSRPGRAHPAPDDIFREFENTFPFEETPDQEQAIEAVLDDLQSTTPMDRLVCGDVGFGKTEVALRAAVLAALGGGQVAILAPTTVLAEQHFVSFSERLRDFPITVGSLSRFRSRKDQQRIVNDAATGNVDVIIGTHRLLSKDVRFKNLTLVVVDEEQRFGVAHKERLKKMRTEVDVLTLTATPIPRTLQMAMGGLREVSLIATPPTDRLAVRTFVCRFDETLLGEAIARERARGGQVFFVHNRVEDLEKWTEVVREMAPNARIAMAHGQMSEARLERVMVDFIDGRTDILCCTTIVESGLDIPRANTMIVNRADRFGLAQLYQLRGRIGRSSQRAYCYLVAPEEGLTPEATERLSVLQRFTELGAGFSVSAHDLEIRGAGELLGGKQSGAIAAIGFEAYTRILEEAVASLRGEPIVQEHDPEISVDVPAFLPNDYVADTGQRLTFYKRLAQASDPDEVSNLIEELADRFGPLPQEAQLLETVMTDKTIIRSLGAVSYELGPQRLVVGLGTQPRIDPTQLLRLVQAKESRFKLTPDNRIIFRFDAPETRDDQARLDAARQCLIQIQSCLPAEA